MKIYLSKTYSDEDGAFAIEGKHGIIYGTKDDILNLCSFFKLVESHINEDENCHMQFRDCFTNWNKKEHIDLEINLIK
ncbi:hypothetical protein [Seonamhaeicola sp. ML3]|uniref:hypothetical protein n=1 Tax=Seonamhaeicola sp. ML3 TaxID=2937786 RepID=UPI00200E3658|nr:hypothetical protein [Seonamhaeicola sp. ML3]